MPRSATTTPPRRSGWSPSSTTTTWRGSSPPAWPPPDATKLNAALDFVLTTRGVPCIYQGTEQAFDGGGDPYDREDMWDGSWEYGPSLGDNFNMTHPLYKRMRDLNDIRSRYDALRTGAFTELKSESAAGIYAFKRTGAVEDVVVVLNSASSARASGTLATAWASGTPLADLRDPSFSLSVGSGGSISFTVPARRARILVRSSAVTSATPAVDTQSPAHAATMASPRPGIRLGFNRAMNHASVEAALTLSPSVPGAFSWEADSAVVFTPSQDWSEGSVVTLHVDASATASDATPMRTAFETFFTIAGGIPGLTVAPGFHATEFASGSGIGVPMGIAAGEGGAWSDNLYVGDALNNRVLRITTAGTVSVLASGSFLSKPEGLDFDHAAAYAGDLMIADPNGLLRVTSAGVVSQIATGTNATNTGALACLPPGPLGGFPYLVSNTSNRVERYEAGTGYVPFASPVNGAEGVAPALGMFGFGQRLLVADPDLATYASSIDGTSSIFFADSTGALSTFVQNPTLLNGVCAMVVDTKGQFGGDLLVANIATETVLRITPAGAISVLASGFGNLFASDCLTIGPDGALYVVDTGSGEPFTDSSGGTAVARIVRVAADTSTGTPGGGGEPPPPFLSVYPNPLSGAGTARFRLEREAMVTLDLFDIRGRRVATPFAGVLPAGPAEVHLDLGALSLARGVYFARVVRGRRFDFLHAGRAAVRFGRFVRLGALRCCARSPRGALSSAVAARNAPRPRRFPATACAPNPAASFISPPAAITRASRRRSSMSCARSPGGRGSSSWSTASGRWSGWRPKCLRPRCLAAMVSVRDLLGRGALDVAVHSRNEGVEVFLDHLGELDVRSGGWNERRFRDVFARLSFFATEDPLAPCAGVGNAFPPDPDWQSRLAAAMETLGLVPVEERSANGS